jgi:hypothetical protein
MLLVTQNFLMICAQQSVQRICGTLRLREAFFWLQVFPTSQAFFSPAHKPLTQTDGADRFASASQIGAIGAADVPPACWPCSLRSRRAIMRMEPTFTQKLRFFVSGGSSAAPLGNPFQFTSEFLEDYVETRAIIKENCLSKFLGKYSP